MAVSSNAINALSVLHRSKQRKQAARVTVNLPVVKIDTGSIQASTGNIRPRAVKGSIVISNEGAAINGCSADS